MPGRGTTSLVQIIVCMGLCALAGCSFGPKALQNTHGRYAEAVREVEEEQLLAQIVRMRYNESFVGVDISSIAAQYELSAGAEARPFFEAPNPTSGVFRTFTNILPDLTVSGTDRPTLSFSPIDDGPAVRRYLTPITLETLVVLTQTSWPTSSIMRLWVERANGVPNAIAASGPLHREAPDFERFLHIAQLLESVHDKELASVRTLERQVEVGGPFAAEAVTPAAAVEAAKNGLEYHAREDGKGWALFRRERRLIIEVSPGAENSPEMLELARHLNLVPGLKTYDIAVGGRGSPDPLKFPNPPGNEVRMVLRSTAQVLYYLSNGVEVPEDHICAGFAHRPAGPDGQPFDLAQVTQGLFAVKVCKAHKPPAHAYTAVRYRDHWFFIDERDQETKATFALVFQLSRLDFARQTISNAPTLTLPVGR